MSFSSRAFSAIKMSTRALSSQNVNRKVVVTKITQKFREATEVISTPIPKPGPGQLLVRNRFAGINASDINVTSARYGAEFTSTEPPFDCGFEGVGEVADVGKDCKLVKPGQSVGYISFGSFADYTLIPESFALPLPSAKAQYIPILVSGLTASLSLEKVGEIKSGEIVLVTAAAGGTGQFAVQLAKAKGCHVIGTCSTDEKVQFLKDLGCDRPINYKKENLGDVLKKEYKKGVDVIYESIGGEVFDTCLTSLAIGGRIIVIGFIEGYENDLGIVKSKKAALIQPYLLKKSASVRGFFMNHFLAYWKEHLARLVALYEKGVIQSKVDNGRFSPNGPFRGVDSVADAVDYLYSRKSIGKIVVELNPEVKSQL